jgi:hypothetical protein
MHLSILYTTLFTIRYNLVINVDMCSFADASAINKMHKCYWRYFSWGQNHLYVNKIAWTDNPCDWVWQAQVLMRLLYLYISPHSVKNIGRVIKWVVLDMKTSKQGLNNSLIGFRRGRHWTRPSALFSSHNINEHAIGIEMTRFWCMTLTVFVLYLIVGLVYLLSINFFFNVQKS